MDPLITTAARALAAGDPLGALKRVALRDDPPALALRGIAMAQLGDLVRAKALLRRAARVFGPQEAVARARCVVAEAEIALVSRDLGWRPGRSTPRAQHLRRIAITSTLRMRDTSRPGAWSWSGASTRPSAGSPSSTPRPSLPHRGRLMSSCWRRSQFAASGRKRLAPRWLGRGTPRATQASLRWRP